MKGASYMKTVYVELPVKVRSVVIIENDEAIKYVNTRKEETN